MTTEICKRIITRSCEYCYCPINLSIDATWIVQIMMLSSRWTNNGTLHSDYVSSQYDIAISSLASLLSLSNRRIQTWGITWYCTCWMKGFCTYLVKRFLNSKNKKLWTAYKIIACMASSTTTSGPCKLTPRLNRCGVWTLCFSRLTFYSNHLRSDKLCGSRTLSFTFRCNLLLRRISHGKLLMPRWYSGSSK